MFLRSNQISVYDAYEIGLEHYRALRDRGEPHLLLDVRDAWEIALAALYPHRHIPLEDLLENLNKLDKKQKIIVLCHKGRRSFRASCLMRLASFESVFSLRGGIDGWSKMIDNNVPCYRK